MLKQVLQQNASKPEAKSNQSQRQIVASRLPVLGMPVETSSIASGYVSARAATEPSDAHQPHATASAWMSQTSTTTRDDTTTGLSTIEGVDLNADVACDAENQGGCEYDNPAEYITAGTCPHCGNRQRFPTCGPCLRDIWEGDSWCPACDQPTAGQEMRIVEVLR